MRNQFKYVSIPVGSKAYDFVPSNLDVFLAEAKRRGEKVVGFRRVGDVWDVKLMAPPLAAEATN